jgi:hypothetical protein
MRILSLTFLTVLALTSALEGNPKPPHTGAPPGTVACAVPDLPAPLAEEKIDLSGEWKNKYGSVYRVKTEDGWILFDDDAGDGYMFGVMRGNVLHTEFSWIPGNGNYRNVGRFELIDGELIGVYGPSNKVKWDAAGNMTGEVYPMKLERVKPAF